MKSPKLNRLTWVTGLLLGTVLLLAACGGAAQESAADPYAEPENEQPVAQSQEDVAEEPTATSAPTDTPEPAAPTDEPATATSQPSEEPAEEEEVVEAEPTLLPEPTATEAPPAKPTPRQGFAATPPGEVQLASGKVQLVEFYATW